MVTLAEPLPHTLLSLPRFAKIMGLNPVHAVGAIGPPAAFPMLDNRCMDVWPQYSWQYSDSVSRFDMALAIQSAEEELATVLGWWPAPHWVYEEVHDFARFYRRDAYRSGGRNVRGMRVSAQAKYTKIIAPGQRGTTLISTATVALTTLAYLDLDADGFFETARVTAATTLTDPLEVEVFFEGTEAHPGWRIWPSRSRSITDSVFTADFDSWLFIDPDVLARYPTSDGFSAIDISTVTHYVTSVDVYRVYNNTAVTSAQFYWEPDVDCGTAGELTVQDGVLHVRSPITGAIVPTPATYADGAWTATSYSVSRDPDMVKLWYYAGDYSNDYLATHTGDPLPQKWALAIAQITVARLERPFCSCGNVIALQNKWKLDAVVGSDELNVTDEDLANPFGTRYGEILAGRLVRITRGRNLGGGTI